MNRVCACCFPRSVVPLSIFQLLGNSSNKRKLAGQLVFPALYAQVWIFQVSYELQQDVDSTLESTQHSYFSHASRLALALLCSLVAFPLPLCPRKPTGRHVPFSREGGWGRNMSKSEFRSRGFFKGCFLILFLQPADGSRCQHVRANELFVPGEDCSPSCSPCAFSLFLHTRLSAGFVCELRRRERNKYHIRIGIKPSRKEKCR